MNALTEMGEGGAIRPVLPAGARRQVAALCRDPGNGKVLLITSRGTGRWVIPKGWPMSDRCDAEAALQEAWEEAGISGVVGDEIGRYAYDKLNERTGISVLVEARVFLVEVAGMAEDYPEAGQRARRWVSPSKAAEMVDEKGLKKILRNLEKPRRIGKGK